MVGKTTQLTADIQWLIHLNYLWQNGFESRPRGMKTKEIMSHTTIMDMQYPIVTNSGRKMGFKFLAGEAYWILSGDNRVRNISKYSKQISQFSDDGYFFNGAYGPMIIDQLTYVVDSLINDNDTRQAVLTIWRPNPRPSKDIPCTTQLQWLIRDGKIHCIDTMRSSDLWLGWVYDVFNMTMLTGYILLLMRERGHPDLKLGKLILNAASQHIYERNFERVEAVVEAKSFGTIDYQPFDPYVFKSPQDLIDHLSDCANGFPKKYDFMRELYGQTI